MQSRRSAVFWEARYELLTPRSTQILVTVLTCLADSSVRFCNRMLTCGSARSRSVFARTSWYCSMVRKLPERARPVPADTLNFSKNSESWRIKSFGKARSIRCNSGSPAPVSLRNALNTAGTFRFDGAGAARRRFDQVKLLRLAQMANVRASHFRSCSYQQSPKTAFWFREALCEAPYGYGPDLAQRLTAYVSGGHRKHETQWQVGVCEALISPRTSQPRHGRVVSNFSCAPLSRRLPPSTRERDGHCAPRGRTQGVVIFNRRSPCTAV
jgi:hypothetical protein